MFIMLLSPCSQYLLKDLVEGGYWNDKVRNQIIADRGSIQKVASIPQPIKDLYKTVWEIKQKAIIDQAVDRGAFICQSQSLNIHMAEPTIARLTSMHFYAWKKGLKTGMYYLRSLPKADAIQFTVDQSALSVARKEHAAAVAAQPAAAAATSAMPLETPVKSSAEPTSAGVAPKKIETSPAGVSAFAGLDYAPEPECESCSA
jgi:ribonucleoside-diphosphate reductase subunit M1